jgi:diaminopimelate decarboxylase
MDTNFKTYCNLPFQSCFVAELTLAEKCGFKGEEIMFTSNDTPSQEYMEAKRLGAIINLDDIRSILL